MEGCSKLLSRHAQVCLLVTDQPEETDFAVSVAMMVKHHSCLAYHLPALRGPILRKTHVSSKPL